MSHDPPPLWLRAAVVVGGVALLLGAAGSAWLLLGGGVRPRPAAGPGLAPRVRLEGTGGAGPIRVEVTWPEAAVQITQPAVLLDAEHAVWLLPSGPEVERVTLLVRQEGPGASRVLLRRTLDVRPGEELVLDVSAPGNAPETR